MQHVIYFLFKVLNLCLSGFKLTLIKILLLHYMSTPGMLMLSYPWLLFSRWLQQGYIICEKRSRIHGLRKCFFHRRKYLSDEVLYWDMVGLTFQQTNQLNLTLLPSCYIMHQQFKHIFSYVVTILCLYCRMHWDFWLCHRAPVGGGD